MRAGILVIGDEILSGNTLDTNSGFAARLLFANNIPLAHTLVVGDTLQAITEGMAWMLDRCELVITTGGLGPTKDDVTKTAITTFYNTELVYNEEVYNDVQALFARRGRVLNEMSKTQAMVPAAAHVVRNPVGTAPVFWMERDGRVLVTLPGVPGEMRHLLEHVLLPRLREKFVKDAIVQRNINLAGIGESDVAMRIAAIETDIENASAGGERYKLAFLPDLNSLRLQVTGAGPDKEALATRVDGFVQQISAIMHDYIYGYGTDNLATATGRMLRDKNATIATAESCTGGYLAHLITSVPGSSDYYTGSVVSYDNRVKINELGVLPQTLEQYGAVSEQTARQMAEGCLKKFGTDYAVSTTGIAGPAGATEGKPVGTVWIAVAGKHGTAAKVFQFTRSRAENIHMFAIAALDMLRREIRD